MCFLISTNLFPMTLTSLPSSPSMNTASRPVSSVESASAKVSLCPASNRISPVFGSTTSLVSFFPFALLAIESFLLNLNLPTFARSYLFGSKKREFMSDSALSSVGGSPGLSFLYISIKASSLEVVLSFPRVASSLSSSPIRSLICSLLP